MTPELNRKALEARKAAIVAGEKYRKDWLDSSTWTSEAKKRGIRLPMWHQPPTSWKLKAWWKRLKGTDFEAFYGCSPKRLIELNPNMPLRAFVGQMLEEV